MRALWFVLISLTVGVAGPASALSLSSEASVFTAASGANDPPNCNLAVSDASAVVCDTTAGSARAQSAFGLLLAAADTDGMAVSSTHEASAVARFEESVTVTGAAAGTLRAAVRVTGGVTAPSAEPGTTASVSTDWLGADQVYRVSFIFGVLPVAGTQVDFDYDPLLTGDVVEALLVEWEFEEGVPFLLGAELTVSVAGTGMALDFLDSAKILFFTGVDSLDNPVALELRDSEGSLLASTVPEPTLAGLIGVVLLALWGGRKN